MRFFGNRNKPSARALRPPAVSVMTASGSQAAALTTNGLQPSTLAPDPFRAPKPCGQGSDAFDWEMRLRRVVLENRSPPSWFDQPATGALDPSNLRFVEVATHGIRAGAG